MSDKTLTISEIFYSVQCEGRDTGNPAVFIRLANCNLSCGFSSKAVVQFKRDLKTNEGYRAGGNDQEYADLMNESKATWCCDSLSVWALQKKKYTFEDVIEFFNSEGILDGIISRDIDLIWTGGEPTLPNHQKDIIAFLKRFEHDYGSMPRNQVETNGTLAIVDEFAEVLDCINCSPKLSNSGMTERSRIKPEVIEQIRDHKNGTFKFVVSGESCIEEIRETFIKPFGIPNSQIWLQPAMDNFDQVQETGQIVAELCKKYQMRMSLRCHVAIWGSLTGV